MALCKDCYNYPKCDFIKHPSNRELTQNDYHNCQEFNGVVAGYRINRIGGQYPNGHQSICKVVE